MPRLTTILVASLSLSAAALSAACSDGKVPATAPTSRPSAKTVRLDPDPYNANHGAQIVRATGDITAAVAEYRGLLGALNPNIAGEQPGGRREINWDGVPPTFTNNDLFPGDFFNATSPRGVLFSTPGSGFRISDSSYVEVNPAYDGEFIAFSPRKLFIANGSTVIDVRFVVAGSTTPAVVTGFGSVFEDVGRAQSTTIEYFGVNGQRLLEVAAPQRTDEKGLSFVGVKFPTEIVARVRITAGDTPLSPTTFDVVKGRGKKHDLVTTDDFIYGEPRPIR